MPSIVSRLLLVFMALALFPLFACTSAPRMTATETGAATLDAAQSATNDCAPVGATRPICGFTNPEDMVPLPGNEALLIGEYGTDAGDHAGGLVLFDLATETRRTAWRGGDGPPVATAGWGDPSCTSAPIAGFNSHGIDLVRRDDGALALLVVQHGSREAVELFEVTGAGTSWKVEWRGCVPSPEDASLNEVAGLPDGGFYATKMASLAGAANLDTGFPTEPTGRAYHWRPGQGFEEIPGTAGIMPNGIVTSPNGRFVYMNASGESSIRKVEVATGRELGRAQVVMPDNVTWSPDGLLLVASLRGLDPELFAACTHQKTGYCPIPFAIVAVDPDTMTPVGDVYESPGRPMGAGTVGLQVGRELFVGSFKGDRILRIDLDAAR